MYDFVSERPQIQLFISRLVTLDETLPKGNVFLIQSLPGLQDQSAIRSHHFLNDAIKEYLPGRVFFLNPQAMIGSAKDNVSYYGPSVSMYFHQYGRTITLSYHREGFHHD